MKLLLLILLLLAYADAVGKIRFHDQQILVNPKHCINNSSNFNSKSKYWVEFDSKVSWRNVSIVIRFEYITKNIKMLERRLNMCKLFRPNRHLLNSFDFYLKFFYQLTSKISNTVQCHYKVFFYFCFI